ncbi:hypothetical protein Pmar_PMAR003443 [Perkinsus marinus ATCC 50983]|uniref:Uncharacterized protein n=1 Tax=Perkinsus marinus (strain ATCC 50983 / TXsc) TaxID=423536 RepID=C5KHC0_PERM5|nr:hypothetical protein Pmar_PMAR003443 [Perkinsus marinus ATCC 50983]EER15982.1 hypothetical protein Pmar_PMAR003443 [Perkinsus marinus ATCC 50983]|eukprot:XP_002784186.1 hypothetical protein Pmar_PMAR003443 [Perkinsus marinus ATCC 50983]
MSPRDDPLSLYTDGSSACVLHFFDPTTFGGLVWTYLGVEEWARLAQCCRMTRAWSRLITETSRAQGYPQWLGACTSVVELALMARSSRLAMGAFILRVALEPQQVRDAGDANGRAILDILMDERLLGLAGHVVRAGPSVCRVTRMTTDALMTAVYKGDERAVEVLSRSGIDLGTVTTIPIEVSADGVPQQTTSAMDPLSLAICTRRGSIVEILLEAGSEPSAQSLAWAIDRKEPCMLRQMLRYIPSPLPSSLQFLLHMAASSGVPDCVDALLSVGCDVNGEDPEGMRPLDLCPRRGKAYTLIQRADRSCAEQRLLDWHLVAASACGSRIAVEALLDWGADPSAMVKSSSPPNRDVCTIETNRLHPAKVDPIPLRKFSMTALHAAACRGHSAVCETLMSNPRTHMHHQAARLARQSLWWNPLVEGPNRSPVMLSNRGRVASELAWEAGYSKLASKLDWEMIIRKVCEDANAATVPQGETVSGVAPAECAKARA